jgi:DNA-binding HxlR family transcriptional regulator
VRNGGTATNAQELEERFQTLAADVAHFSSRVVDIIMPEGKDRSWLAAENLEIARTMFGKWCIEIFVILYNLGPVGFEGLRRRLGAITPRVLSRKLRMMEDQGIVRRDLVNSRPPGVRYSLTEKGETVARIGTPVFLFLSFRK